MKRNDYTKQMYIGACLSCVIIGLMGFARAIIINTDFVTINETNKGFAQAIVTKNKSDSIKGNILNIREITVRYSVDGTMIEKNMHLVFDAPMLGAIVNVDYYKQKPMISYLRDYKINQIMVSMIIIITTVLICMALIWGSKKFKIVMQKEKESEM